MEQTKQSAIQQVVDVEGLAEKKADIYARLLTNPTLAKDMESLAKRHQERKTVLQQLLGNVNEGGQTDEV